MKVLHFVSTFSKLSETFIYDVVVELEKQGLDNYILTHEILNSDERPFDKVVLAEKPHKWNIERLLYTALWGFSSKALIESHWKVARKRILKSVKEINPDIIHSHFGPAGALISLIAYELKIPHVISFHGYDVFELTKNDFWKQQYKMLNDRNTYFTCVSSYMKKYISDLNIISSERLSIIHVGKKVEEYQVERQYSQVRNWLSIGRLIDKKGHEDCIKAFGQIVKNNPNQQLRIIGEGENREILQDLIDDLELNNNVVLLGSISHNKVKEHLFTADAFILCSKTAASGDKEGIPTVLMEAQLLGLPCVSTRHSGIPEVFPEKSQFLLAEEGDIDSIVKSMKYLIESPQERLKKLGDFGRQKIEQHFNLELEVAKLIKTYDRAISIDDQNQSFYGKVLQAR